MPDLSGTRQTRHWRIGDRDIPRQVASQQSLLPFHPARLLSTKVRTLTTHWISERCLKNPMLVVIGNKCRRTSWGMRWFVIEFLPSALLRTSSAKPVFKRLFAGHPGPSKTRSGRCRSKVVFEGCSIRPNAGRHACDNQVSLA